MLLTVKYTSTVASQLVGASGVLAAFSFAVLMQFLTKERPASQMPKGSHAWLENGVVGASLFSTLGLLVSTIVGAFIVIGESHLSDDHQTIPAFTNASLFAFWAFDVGFVALFVTIGLAARMYNRRWLGWVALAISLLILMVTIFCIQTLITAIG